MNTGVFFQLSDDQRKQSLTGHVLYQILGHIVQNDIYPQSQSL